MNHKITVKPYDTAEFLATPQDVYYYLNEVLASGDSALIAAALGNIAGRSASSAPRRRRPSPARSSSPTTSTCRSCPEARSGGREWVAVDRKSVV